MSEHNGPLELGKPYAISKGDYRGTVIRQRAVAGRGEFVLIDEDGCRGTYSELPESWALGEPLVPQTEVDAVKAELADSGTKAAAPLLALDITDPERVRNLAAELAAYSAVHVLHVPVGSESAWVRMASPFNISARADRIEQEQAAKAEQDKLIEAVAKVIRPYAVASYGPTGQARALLAAFDITPKAGA